MAGTLLDRFGKNEVLLLLIMIMNDWTIDQANDILDQIKLESLSLWHPDLD